MNKQCNILLSLALSVVSLVIATNTASANRWASLRQNQLIEDKENVYLYPQLLLDYRNSIGFDYGFNNGAEAAAGESELLEGGRVLYLGGWNKLGLGMSAHYGSIAPAFSAPIPNDLLSQETSALYLGENGGFNLFPTYALGPAITTLSGGPAEALPFTIVDAFIALPIGIGAFGGRLGIASRGEYTTTDDQDQGSDETLLTLEAGISGKGDVRWDTSLNLAFDFYGAENQVDDEETSGTLIRVGLSGRAYLPFANKVDLGLLGNIVFGNGSVSVDSGGSTVDGNGLGFGVMGGAGPVFRINPNVIIAGYALLGIAFSALDQPGDEDLEDTVSDLMIFIPAIRIAADIGITDWFFFRGGVQYSFQLASSSLDEYASSPDPDNESPPDSVSRRNGQLGLSAGIGLKTTMGFTFDGTLYRGFLTAGPDFIGGDPRALFGVVSAAYHW